MESLQKVMLIEGSKTPILSGSHACSLFLNLVEIQTGKVIVNCSQINCETGEIILIEEGKKISSKIDLTKYCLKFK